MSLLHTEKNAKGNGKKKDNNRDDDDDDDMPREICTHSRPHLHKHALLPKKKKLKSNQMKIKLVWNSKTYNFFEILLSSSCN